MTVYSDCLKNKGRGQRGDPAFGTLNPKLCVVDFTKLSIIEL